MLRHLRTSAWALLCGGKAPATLPLADSPRDPPYLDLDVPFRPINELGPHFIDLFETLYKLYVKLFENNTQRTSCLDKLCTHQRWVDTCWTDLKRVEGDERTDFSAMLDFIRETQSRAVEDRSARMASLEILDIDHKRMQSAYDSAWSEVWKHAQEYLNRCFEVYFAFPWCIDHDRCLRMRSMLDINKLLQIRRNELRALKLRRAWDRQKGTDVELEKQIETLQLTLELMEKAQREECSRFIHATLPLLRNSGRIPPEPPSQQPTSSQGRRSPAASNERRDGPGEINEMSEDSPRSNEEANHGPIERRYELANTHLVQLQDDLQRHEAQWQPLLGEHLICFPRSSETRFRDFVNWLAKDLKHELEIAEDELQTIVDEYERLGLQAPRDLSRDSTTESTSRSDSEHGDRSRHPSQRNETHNKDDDDNDGGDGGGGGGGGGGVQRVPVNRWRTLLKPAGFGLKTPSPPGGTGGESGFSPKGPSPTSSSEAPASLGRKRRLEEYTSAQEKSREEFERVIRMRMSSPDRIVPRARRQKRGTATLLN